MDLTTIDDGETVVLFEGMEEGYLNMYKFEVSSNPNRYEWEGS